MIFPCTSVLSYNILPEKSLATPDYFVPYLINVTTTEYCLICLKTAFIAKELCVKMLVVIGAAEE